jgi:hypothetical protein
MKRFIFLPIALSFSLNYADGNNLQEILREKLELFAMETNQAKRSNLQAEIEEIKNSLNQNSQLRKNAPSAPIGSTQQNLNRQTYFYRGPVNNPTNYTPFLDTSAQRGYGANTYVLEGRPVYMPYNGGYVNEVANIGGDPHRSTRLNYGGTSPANQGQMYQNPGSSYYPPGYQYQHQGYYGNQAYPQNMYNYGYNQPYNMPYGQQYGYNPYNQYAQQQNSNLYNEEYLNNRTMYLTAYDAKQRFMNEIRMTPMPGNNLSVEVANQTRLEDGRIQLIVRAVGGVTGAGRNEERIYVYNRNGVFMEARERPIEGMNSSGNALQLKRYDLSRQQMLQIDQYLTYNRLNQYGDPIGTMYAGGSPLSLVADQANDETTRYSYILNKMPALLNLFGIQQ